MPSLGALNISQHNEISIMEFSQAYNKFMDWREITRGESTLHSHNVLKLQGMVDQVSPSSKLEAQGGRVNDANPSGGRRQEEGAAKGSKTS